MFPEPGIVTRSAAPRGGVYVERNGRAYVMFELWAEGAAPAVEARVRGRLARLAQVGLEAFPRVVAVAEASGGAFAVFEAPTGITLERILEQRALSERELLDVAHDLGAALGALHDVGETYGELSLRTVISEAGRWSFADYGDSVFSREAVESSARKFTAAGRRDWADDLVSLGRLLTGCLAHSCDCAADRVEWSARLGLDGLAAPRLTSGLVSAGAYVAELLRRAQLDGPPVPNRRVIGRREELTALRRLVAQMHGPRAAVLRGVPGMGKTHLLEALVSETTTTRVLRAGCHQWDASFFGVVAQLLEAWVCNADGSANAAGVAEVRSLVGDLDQLFRSLSSRLRNAIAAAVTRVPADLSEDVYTDGLVEAITRLFRSRPVLVAIEDVQWMDEASRKVLRRVIDIADYPVLFVVTARSNLDDSVQAQRFLGSLQAITVWDCELEALTAAQSSELAAHHLRTLPLASEQAYALGVLGDGTPLGVIEVVRFVLDAGLLVPNWERWKLDVAGVASLRLPTETVQLIAHRIRGLTQEAIELLQVAALLGGRFEASLLRAVSESSPEHVAAVLTEAQRCQLIEALDGECYRFVHQSACDALTAGCDAERLCAGHARALVRLHETSGNDFDSLDTERVFRAAHHAVLALDRAPRAIAFAALLGAGKRAFTSFDNARALELLTHADRLASNHERRVNGLSALIGELHLRVGNLPASAACFRSNVEQQETDVQRARTWSRIALIHENEFDSEAAWTALGEAFRCLKEPFPQSKVPVLLRLPALLTAVPVRHAVPKVSGEAKERAELLCQLLFQLSHLAIVRSQLGPLLDAAGRARRLVTELGSSPSLSRVNNVFAFVQAIFGRRTAAQTFASEALALAESQGDPQEQAYSVFSGAALAIWRDELDRGIELAHLHITRYRNWISPQDIATTALNIAVIEGIRGRAREAWPWLEQAGDRALQYEGVVPVISEILYLMCRATALHLGIDAERGEWLEKLRRACRPVPEGSGFFLWSLGARARVLTEEGAGGQELWRFMARVDALKLNPKRVHLAVAEYYLYVGHGLIHEYLRAPQTQRAQCLARLEVAVRDMRGSARLGTLRAHVRVVQGYIYLFKGHSRRAEREFSHAERMAREHNASWVLYAVARGRAHALRKGGLQADSERQARLAEQLATDSGSVHQARWVREEFGPGRALSSAGSAALLNPEPAQLLLQSTSDIRNERHIQALLGISQVNTAELDPEQQARAVLDEMIDAIRAERGFLLLRASGSGGPNSPTSVRDLTVVAGRNRSRMNLTEAYRLPHAALEQVLQERRCVLLDAEGDETSQVLAVPLAVRDTVVGVVCLESDSGSNPFDARDGQVLAALVGQVSFALELTRAVRDRERLAEDLQQSQKMEAVGRLAGGIAHDFNNMLAAICVSVEAVMSEAPAEASYRSDLETIQGAAERAARLTRQLLAFSRRQVFDARPLDLNDTVREITPMLQRLLGGNIQIETELDPSLCLVKTDAAQFEQVLVNLAVNARDAMPHGGRVLVRTREEQLETGQKPGLDAGSYAVIQVIDDGVGMDQETQRRIFEPFFTTKAREEGTGLGLAMVYGIVRQSAGRIELDSAPGRGTEFRVYLPKTTEAVVTLAPPARVTQQRVDSARVLLVDDEPLVRHAFRRALKRLGHNVVGAASAREAIQYLQQQPDVDLIITDVIMPGMNGLEMIERLQRLGIRAKVLYVSGYADGVLSRRSGLGERVEFMQKPIQSEALAAKVQDLLRSEPLDRRA